MQHTRQESGLLLEVKYLPVAINTGCYGQDNTKYRLASAAIKIHYDDVQ